MVEYGPVWFLDFGRQLPPNQLRECHRIPLPRGNYSPSIVQQARRTFDEPLTRQDIQEREFRTFWDEPNFGLDTPNHIAYIRLIHQIIDEFNATRDFHTSESEKRILYLFSPHLYPTDIAFRFQVYIPSQRIYYQDVEAEILILYHRHIFNIEETEDREFLSELHKGFYSQIW